MEPDKLFMIEFADCSLFLLTFTPWIFSTYVFFKNEKKFGDPVPSGVHLLGNPVGSSYADLPYGDAGWLVVILAQSVIAPHLKIAA